MLDPQALSDHLEITQVLYRYGLAIDRRDFTLLATVFTPDASIQYNVPGGTTLRFTEAGEWLRVALSIFRVTHHVLSNPMIDLDGDSARATTYLTATHVQVKLDGQESAVVQLGVYTDVLVRTRAGWRITERRLDAVWTEGTFHGPDEVQRFMGSASR